MNTFTRRGRVAAALGLTVSTLLLLACAATVTPPSHLTFSGYTWDVKNIWWGPGPNTFSLTAPRVDSKGVIHLRILRDPNVRNDWACSEVILDHPLGYGTYEWTVRGPIDGLDPNVVLGLFTWDDADTSPSHREIDVEVARWGDAANPTNAQWVVQPYDHPEDLQRLSIPAAATVRLRFKWSPGNVSFSGDSTNSSGVTKPLPQWSNNSADVPTPDTERTHMNLWLERGKAPTNGKNVDIAISRFRFTHSRSLA